jgi:fatty acid synthase
LNVCLHHQFEIYVTVGTQDKRDYLRKHYPQIPESHIGNSRDTSFEEMIKAGTNDRGVDAVLNSLSEDKLRASVRCLARGGRFLEIGKFDLANDSSLNLLLLERGASYHGIMLDRIFKNSAELKVKLIDALYKGVHDGYVKPLPRVVFGRDELVPSFKYMTNWEAPREGVGESEGRRRCERCWTQKVIPGASEVSTVKEKVHTHL